MSSYQEREMQIAWDDLNSQVEKLTAELQDERDKHEIAKAELAQALEKLKRRP